MGLNIFKEKWCGVVAMAVFERHTCVGLDNLALENWSI